MKELLKQLINALITKPEAAVITETVTEEGWELVLQVAPEDMGKVIGKQGRIAKAIRTVLKAAAAKEGKKVNLEIE